MQQQQSHIATMQTGSLFAAAIIITTTTTTL